MTSIPRFIKTFTSMEIPDNTTNKILMIVKIIKWNRFFLTNIMIYIIYTKKLQVSQKELVQTKSDFCFSDAIEIFSTYLYISRILWVVIR